MEQQIWLLQKLSRTRKNPRQRHDYFDLRRIGLLPLLSPPFLPPSLPPSHPLPLPLPPFLPPSLPLSLSLSLSLYLPVSPSLSLSLSRSLARSLSLSLSRSLCLSVSLSLSLLPSLPVLFLQVQKGINKVVFPKKLKGNIEALVKGLCNASPSTAPRRCSRILGGAGSSLLLHSGERLPMKKGGTQNIKTQAVDHGQVSSQDVPLPVPPASRAGMGL